jgi:hypothetical protein
VNTPFFETHDRFLQSSPVGNWPDRLNLRYEAIIQRTAAQLKGARVLDIASHDGRWSFAALEAGAAHVTGVEVRPELSAIAQTNINSDRFLAVTGDVFTRRAIFDQPFDVVLCLGFLYHTTRHEEIFDLIRATNARTVVIDTRLTPGEGNFVQIRKERADHPANGMADRGVRDKMILHGWPTRGAVTFMLDHFGYSVDFVDWPNLIARHRVYADPNRGHGPDNPVGDYAAGDRGTFIGSLM